MLWDGSPVKFRPGPGDSGLGKSGVHAPLAAFDAEKAFHTFAFTLRLQGTESLSVAPLGAST
jgi:inner membrane protein involved in colicin E2 resistance